MRRADKLLRLIFISALLVSFAHLVFADGNSDGVISRPVIEYSSGDLRDPFSDLFQLAVEKEKKEKEEQDIQVPLVGSADPEKSMPSLEKFKVQGVIWGGKFPQAIINNKILGTGDLIDGAEIVSIEKKGITLSFSGRLANLPTPGNAEVSEKVVSKKVVSEKVDKEEK